MIRFQHSPTTVPRRERGFTLLELLVVLGLIAVLMGLGVGFLQRGATDLDVARTVVLDQLRVASNTARARSLPTEVRVLAGSPGEPVTMHTLGLRPVATWHFEPDQRFLDARLRPDLNGSAEPGRFGMALRPEPETGALLRVGTGTEDVFDLAAGFAVRVDVRPETRDEQVVVRLGRAFELLLRPDLVPEAVVTLAAPGNRAGASITVRGRRPLPAHEWLTLELAHDGREVVLSVDGRQEARAEAPGPPYQQDGDVLEASPSNAPVRGLVDELELLAYERGEPQALPPSVGWEGLQGPIAFDRQGRLAAPRPAEFALVLGEERESWEIGPGGVLR